MSARKLPAHTVGSDNIFADLGLPDAKEHQLKAALAVQVRRMMNERKLTQAQAAKLAGISQAELSMMLRGQFRHLPVEKLMRVQSVIKSA